MAEINQIDSQDQDDDVVIVGGENRVTKVLSMKFSIYGKYVAIVTELDELVNNEELIIREEESFPYFKRLTDLDFMGETLFLALAVRDLGVVIWDEINKTTLKEYPIIDCNINKISVFNEYMTISLPTKIQVLVQNQCLRYITNVSPLNPQTISQIESNTFYQDIKFQDCKTDTQNYCIAYFLQQRQYLIIENISRGFMIGFDFVTYKQLTEDLIIQIQEKQIQELIILKNQILNKSVLVHEQSKDYLIHQNLVFFTLKHDRFAVSEYLNKQCIQIFRIDWVEGKLTKMYDLYRGKNPKELSITFGPDDLIGVLSFSTQKLREKLNQGNLEDGTLHIFYDMKENEQNLSKTRYYFRTATQLTQPHNRVNDTLLHFINSNMFRLISKNNFYFKQMFDKNVDKNVLSITLKDQQKNPWQNQLISQKDK